MQRNVEIEKSKLTQGDLKKLLSYDSSTGEFTWLVKRGGIRPGVRAGSVCTEGYIQIRINNKSHSAHRLAWLYVYGKFPESGIDHINGKKADNAISNLREANQKENMQNAAIYKSNKTGFIGVHFHKTNKKYQATIKAFGKQKHLGYFDTAELAFEAYKEAKQALHSFHPETISRASAVTAAT